MTISYFISVPSFKSTAFVVWILARDGGGGRRGVNLPLPPPCFKATLEPPCTIGLRDMKINGFGVSHYACFKTGFLFWI